MGRGYLYEPLHAACRQFKWVSMIFLIRLSKSLSNSWVVDKLIKSPFGDSSNEYTNMFLHLFPICPKQDLTKLLIIPSHTDSSKEHPQSLFDTCFISAKNMDSNYSLEQ